MKKAFFISGVIAAAVMVFSCTPDRFVINGTYSNPSDTSGFVRKAILFSEYSDYTDTAVIENGAFRMEGTCDTPLPCKIKVTGVNGYHDIILENAVYDVKITAGGLFATSEITGGEAQESMNRVVSAVKGFYQANGMDASEYLNALASPFFKGNRDSVFRVYMDFSMKADSIRKEVVAKEIAKNPKSFFALMQLDKKMFYRSPDDVAEEFASFGHRYDGNPIAGKIQSFIEKSAPVMRGKRSPDFIMPDLQGDTVRFSDVYSKAGLTLLEFWSAGDRKSGEFNLLLKDLYAKYSDKGLAIVSVSLQEDMNLWRNVVADEDLGSWVQLSNGKMFDNQVRKVFCVNFYPQVIAVSADGHIVDSRMGLERRDDIIRLVGETLGEDGSER